MHELRRGGLFIATPVTCVCINWLICLIYSALLSKRKKKNREKRHLPTTFPRCHDPKSGHKLCCHKLTPIMSPCVLIVFPFTCFPFNACSIPGGRKAYLFRFSWSPSGCSTVYYLSQELHCVCLCLR